LLIVYKESSDEGNTWSDNIWVDQNLVPDMPGSVPGIEGHYSNSFFDGLMEPDGDIHFCAVLADSGHFENESEILGLYDIHQVDGQWAADLICDGTYPGFNPRELFLDGDSWLHSPSLSLGPDGMLIASWNDVGWFESDSLFSLDIWAAASLDGGDSWLDPVRITSTPDVDEYFSKLFSRTTDEFAYVLTMYWESDGPVTPTGPTDGPLDMIQVDISALVPDLADTPIPHLARLSGPAPNPFSNTATFSLDLSSPADTEIGIYNVAGELVSVLHSGRLDAGRQEFVFEAGKTSPGVYFCRARTGNETISKKLVLIR